MDMPYILCTRMYMYCTCTCTNLCTKIHVHVHVGMKILTPDNEAGIHLFVLQYMYIHVDVDDTYDTYAGSISRVWLWIFLLMLFDSADLICFPVWA